MKERKRTAVAWDAWEGVYNYTQRSVDRHKTFLGPRSPKSCKFCGRTNAETTFKKVAHVIPAAFGNRTLFSNEECDECNLNIGSALEDDLAKFLSLPRAIARLSARKGPPKIRHPNQAAFVKSNREKNEVYVFQPSDDEGVRLVDEGNGSLRLSIDTPAYRPINVARALGRLLLFVLDPGEPGFDRIRSWVRREVDWFPIPLVILHFSGPGRDGISLMVHRRVKPMDRKILRVGFLYSSFLTMMPIPLDVWSLPAGLEIVNYPAPYQTILLENTSVFTVKDNEIERGGLAEAVFTSEGKTEA